MELVNWKDAFVAGVREGLITPETKFSMKELPNYTMNVYRTKDGNNFCGWGYLKNKVIYFKISTNGTISFEKEEEIHLCYYYFRIDIRIFPGEDKYLAGRTDFDCGWFWRFVDHWAVAIPKEVGTPESSGYPMIRDMRRWGPPPAEGLGPGWFPLEVDPCWDIINYLVTETGKIFFIVCDKRLQEVVPGVVSWIQELLVGCWPEHCSGSWRTRFTRLPGLRWVGPPD